MVCSSSQIAVYKVCASLKRKLWIFFCSITEVFVRGIWYVSRSCYIYITPKSIGCILETQPLDWGALFEVPKWKWSFCIRNRTGKDVVTITIAAVSISTLFAVCLVQRNIGLKKFFYGFSLSSRVTTRRAEVDSMITFRAMLQRVLQMAAVF